MMNSESNATKFMEQGEDIGLPRDVTMDILNRYATYGANTGIGNLGGERLVNALNDEYRKRVDEPLQSNPPEMFTGGLTAIAEILQNLGSSAIEGIGNVGSSIADVFTSGGAEAASGAADSSAAAVEAVNSPVTISSEGVRTAGEGLGEVTLDVASPDLASVDPSPDPTRLEKFQKYLDENPLVAKQLMSSGQDIGKILGQALGGGSDRKRSVPVRAPRPRFQPGTVRSQRIGMEDGGSVLGRKLFLDGGEVDGPGGPKEDLVPIWASDKEYVVSHQGVKNIGGGDFDKGIAALDKVNFGK
jgi:hypothetical protein